eukprot:201936-Prorocentrum_minimum.AAC.1
MPELTKGKPESRMVASRGEVGSRREEVGRTERASPASPLSKKGVLHGGVEGENKLEPSGQTKSDGYIYHAAPQEAEAKAAGAEARGRQVAEELEEIQSKLAA